jgi:hypothetical protein
MEISEVSIFRRSGFVGDMDVMTFKTSFIASRLQSLHIFCDTVIFHVRWIPYRHGMAHPQVVEGGNALQVWREAANILNKQSWTADKGWSSSMGVGRGANDSSP